MTQSEAKHISDFINTMWVVGKHYLTKIGGLITKSCEQITPHKDEHAYPHNILHVTIQFSPPLGRYYYLIVIEYYIYLKRYIL